MTNEQQEIEAALLAFWYSRTGNIRKYSLPALAGYLVSDGWSRQPQPVGEHPLLQATKVTITDTSRNDGKPVSVSVDFPDALSDAQQRIQELVRALEALDNWSVRQGDRIPPALSVQIAKALQPKDAG